MTRRAARLRERLEPLAQLVHGQVGGVDDLVGQRANLLQLPALRADAFDDGPAVRERMGPPRLAESPDQRFMARFEEDEGRVQPGGRLELPPHARKLAEETALADVDDQRHFRQDRAFTARQRGERRHELRGEIVDAEVAEVLQRANRLRLAGARESGEHDEPAAPALRCGPSCAARAHFLSFEGSGAGHPAPRRAVSVLAAL